MENNDKIKEWIRFAEMDRDTVNILFNSHKKPIEIICYHCQQAVEKYLKACLIMYNTPVLKTHDLAELNTICTQHNNGFSSILDECIYLTDFGVQARYPEHRFDLTDKNLTKAVSFMDKACNYIIDVLEIFLNEKS